MKAPVDLTKEAAAEHLRSAAFTTEEPSVTLGELRTAVERNDGDYDAAVDELEADATPARTLIHCFRGTIGADWDLDAVLELVAGADRVAWAEHWCDHELAVEVSGRVYRFDVAAPEGTW